MRTYRFITIFGFMLLCLNMVSCTKDENPAPTVKGYLNGVEVKEIKVTMGTSVKFKYEIQSSSPLSKVEVFVRKGIGLATDSQLFLRKEVATGDLEGNTYTVEGTLVATTDLMISVGVIDVDGKNTILQRSTVSNTFSRGTATTHKVELASGTTPTSAPARLRGWTASTSATCCCTRWQASAWVPTNQRNGGSVRPPPGHPRALAPRT